MIDRFLASVVASVLVISPAHSGWDDYREKTLASTIEENKSILGSADFNYVPGLPQLTLVRYAGKQRRTSGEKEMLIRGWVKAIGRKPDSADMFLEEALFEENGKTYWLPVQKPLIPYLKRELRAGDGVWLYVVWIGTTRTDWVFIINEFNKAESPPR